MKNLSIIIIIIAFFLSCNKNLTKGTEFDSNLILKMTTPSYVNDFCLFSNMKGKSVYYNSSSSTNSDTKYLIVDGISMPRESTKVNTFDGRSVETLQKGTNDVNGKKLATTYASYTNKLSPTETNFFNGIFGKSYSIIHNESSVSLSTKEGEKNTYIPNVIDVKNNFSTKMTKGSIISWNADPSNKIGVIINFESVSNTSSSRIWETVLVPDNGAYTISDKIYNKFKKFKDIDVEIGRGNVVENVDKTGTKEYTKIAFVTYDYYSTVVE